MASHETRARPNPTARRETQDGRRKRSDRSRKKIIDAMFDLLRDGDMHPSAVSVAARAGVGLRTVFRHFEDMDTIYDEMAEAVMSAVLPKIIAPFEATDWHGRLDETLEKRADIYETIFPVKVCMALRRFQSDFLRKRYDQDVALLRARLVAVVPEVVSNNKARFAALELALSFSTWRRLRQDQNLSVIEAKRTVKLMLDALTAGIDAA